MSEVFNRISNANPQIQIWDRVSGKLAPLNTSESGVDISVLVCCRNFLQRFKMFAKSILVQEGALPRFEVIVANPDSPDGLGDYLRLLADKTLKEAGCPVFLEEKVDPAHERNRGYMIQRAFERSRGKVVIGMDCDLVLPKGFLREINNHCLQNPNAIVGVYRNFLSAATTSRILSGEIDPVENFPALEREDNNEEQGYRGVLGYCQAAPRAIWEFVGYPTEFDEIAKSDVTFMDRAACHGIRPLFLSNLRVLHLHHKRNWSGTEERY